MSSLLGAGGDRKVTPGVTGSSRARAPIDPAVWYLGPSRAQGQNRGNAIEVIRKKNEASAYIGETRPPLTRSPAQAGSLGRAGEGNAEGSPTGRKHSDRRFSGGPRTSSSIRRGRSSGSPSVTVPSGTRPGSSRSQRTSPRRPSWRVRSAPIEKRDGIRRKRRRLRLLRLP